ncbi:unnamed protein product [Candida verbasci]|uniref:Uncharacterized protein n=1 Tax=Candida verbasci TaxID=1227364 RepID=A0A9W4XCI6_9ASCO|nr:unnamed protein product [Candida verbasci]
MILLLASLKGINAIAINHKHHNHISYTLNIRDNAMPTMTDSSSETFTASIPTIKNPFIHESKLPLNLIFIIFGAILFAILLGVITHRIILYYIYNFKAKNEKEVYFANFNNLFHSDNDSSIVSRFDEKGSSYNTTTSSTLSSPSTNVTLLSHGKSYRNSIFESIDKFEKEKANRKSTMFTNPSLEYNKLNTPLYNHENYSVGSRSLYNLDLNLSFIDNLESNDDVTLKEQPKRPRTPSLVLDDILNNSIEKDTL